MRWQCTACTPDGAARSCAPSPGIGPIHPATIRAELGDVARFATVDSVRRSLARGRPFRAAGGNNGRTTAHGSSVSRTPFTHGDAAHPVPFRNSF